MEIDAVKTVKVNAKTIRVHVKACDQGSYTLLDADGDEICDRDECYVPDFFPENGGGDYLFLEIDIDTGRITNWTAPSRRDVEAWIRAGG